MTKTAEKKHIKIIKESREDIKNGNSISWDEFLHNQNCIKYSNTLGIPIKIVSTRRP